MTVARRILFVLVALLAVAGGTVYACRDRLTAFMLTPALPFAPDTVPAAPDYSTTRAWLFLPDRPDAADQVPAGAEPGDLQATAKADAFYIHPTTYLRAGGWNADYDDTVARGIANSLTQATIFNGCCRIYAPAYRQAALAAVAGLTADDRASAHRAIDLAYGDIRQAFVHYLKTWNDGRPIVLVAHSQGSLLLQRLLAEFFPPGSALAQHLVVAYAAGFPLPLDLFGGALAGTRPCAGPGDTGCVIAWSTIARDGDPDFYLNRAEIWNGAGEFASVRGRPLLCVNPVSFAMDGQATPASANKGGSVYSVVSGQPEPLTHHLVAAQCIDGILRITEPAPFVFRAVLLPGRDYHAYDYALFYADIRADAIARVAAYGAARR